MKFSVRRFGALAGVLTGLLAGPLILHAALTLPAGPVGRCGNAVALAAAPEGKDDCGVVRQDRPRNCGAAVLAMAASRWGLRITLREAERLAGTGEDGTTLLGLRDAARSLGMTATGVRFPEHDAASLLSLKPPVVLRLRGPHFVLLEGVDRSRSRVTVADPALGRICRPVEAFARGWTGEALLLASPPCIAGTCVRAAKHG